jgi:hypothetical protein
VDRVVRPGEHLVLFLGGERQDLAHGGQRLRLIAKQKEQDQQRNQELSPEPDRAADRRGEIAAGACEHPPQRLFDVHVSPHPLDQRLQTGMLRDDFLHVLLDHGLVNVLEIACVLRRLAENLPGEQHHRRED